MPDLLLRDFEPRPKLVSRDTVVTRPRYPVFDAHNHLGEEFGGSWENRPVHELLDVLDESRVELLVDLDGGWGEDILYRHLILHAVFQNRGQLGLQADQLLYGL